MADKDVSAVVTWPGTRITLSSEGASVPRQLDEAWTAPTVDDRPGVEELLGQPFAFKVTFEEVEGTVVRFESWVYPELSTRVDFIDGEASWTIEIDPVPMDGRSPAV